MTLASPTCLITFTLLHKHPQWITATETQFGWSYTHNDPVFVSLINGPPYGRAPLTRDAVAKTIFRVKASAGDFGNKDHSKWTGFADVAAYL